jgi:hypothetical protein
VAAAVLVVMEAELAERGD